MSGHTRPIDTSQAASRRYFELLRLRSPAQRAVILAGLVKSVRQLAAASVRLTHPGASERELQARVAARLYGDEIASRFYPDVDRLVAATSSAEASRAHCRGMRDRRTTSTSSSHRRSVVSTVLPTRSVPTSSSIATCCAMPIKSPEDSVLRKLLWYRAGDGVSDNSNWSVRLACEDLLARAEQEATA